MLRGQGMADAPHPLAGLDTSWAGATGPPWRIDDASCKTPLRGMTITRLGEPDWHLARGPSVR
jgi:hypothetical protein